MTSDLERKLLAKIESAKQNREAADRTNAERREAHEAAHPPRTQKIKNFDLKSLEGRVSELERHLKTVLTRLSKIEGN